MYGYFFGRKFLQINIQNIFLSFNLNHNDGSITLNFLLQIQNNYLNKTQITVKEIIYFLINNCHKEAIVFVGYNILI